jgi:hypothetical protein
MLMKKLIFITIIFFFVSICFAQNKSDLTGIWKAIVKAGNKPTTPTYLLFNANGTYKWGVDSGGNEISGGTITTGNWDLTTDNEIKLVPDDKSNEIRYYTPTGDNMLYKYKYYENGGGKKPFYTTDMSQFIQKL